MSDSSPHDLVKAATAYETLFVPALFAQWAPKVAERAEIQPGQKVLDVACGTGVLARELAVRVGASGHVVGIDPGPGMIAVARQLAPTIEWRGGIAEALPFPEASFDAVVSQFGLMFFSDRVEALREMRRVATRGARLALAVWDTLESMPAYQGEVALLDRLAGREAAAALRAPFVLGDAKALAAMFLEAGIAVDRIETIAGMADFPSMRTMVEADLRGWLPIMGVNLSEELIHRILDEVDSALGRFATVDGRSRFALSAHVVTATRH